MRSTSLTLTVPLSTPIATPVSIPFTLQEKNLIMISFRLPSIAAAVEKVGVRIVKGKSLLGFPIFPNVWDNSTGWITGDGSYPIVFDKIVYHFADADKDFSLQAYNLDTTARVVHCEFTVAPEEYLYNYLSQKLLLQHLEKMENYLEILSKKAQP